MNAGVFKTPVIVIWLLISTTLLIQAIEVGSFQIFIAQTQQFESILGQNMASECTAKTTLIGQLLHTCVMTLTVAQSLV